MTETATTRAPMREAGESDSTGKLGHYYTVKEISASWRFSPKVVRKLFNAEPDVLKYGDRKRGKRPYKTLMISDAAVERVRMRLSGVNNVIDGDATIRRVRQYKAAGAATARDEDGRRRQGGDSDAQHLPETQEKLRPPQRRPGVPSLSVSDLG